MRKYFLVGLLCVAGGLSASAQVAKGSILLGGSLGFNRESDEYLANKHTSTGFSLQPRVSYAVANNLLVGARLGYSYSKAENNQSSSATMNGYSGGLFARKLMPIAGAFGWFGEIGGLYSYSKSRNAPSSGNTSTTEYRSISASITPGLYYKPASSWLLSLDMGNLGYSHSKVKSASVTSTTNTFGLSFLQNFNFGVDVIF